MSGPLSGVRVIEIAGIGPAPFCGMMLADMGADVVRIDRPNTETNGRNLQRSLQPIDRGRRSVAIDLKNPEGVETVLSMITKADALIEGFRPGVMERLGLGPEVCLEEKPDLVYGRMTGWGQDGPYSSMAGHDINYISLAGALEPIGRAGGPPVPPLSLVGDFGGGGMLLAFGVVCGIVQARKTGTGQVIDAAMVDGAAALTAAFHGLMAMGQWAPERGTNLVDSGAHFYDVYETSDGKYISIGSVEPHFYAELLRLLGLEGEELGDQHDREAWPHMKERVAGIIRGRTRAEWTALLEGTDVCFAPVLSMSEAPQHRHNVFRQTFVEDNGVVQPAPAPRFSATPGEIRLPPALPGEHSLEVLVEHGFSEEDVAALRRSGAVH